MSATVTENQLSTEAQEAFGEILIDANGNPISEDVTLSDVSLISESLESVKSGIASAIEGETKLSTVYATIATAIMALREQCVLPNGHPDWAGRTKTYWALLHSVTDPLYASLEGTSRKQKVQRGIDNQMALGVRDNYIREYVLRGLPETDATPTKDGKPRASVKSAMKAEFDAQGVKKDGSANLTLPALYGGPEKEGRSAGTVLEPGSPEAIGEHLIQAIGSAVKVDGKGIPKVSYDFTVNALLSGVSRAVRGIVENRDEEIPERTSLADKYHRLSQLAELANKALSGEWDDVMETALDAVAYDSNEDR